jgi:hypothetical protein
METNKHGNVQRECGQSLKNGIFFVIFQKKIFSRVKSRVEVEHEYDKSEKTIIANTVVNWTKVLTIS